MSLPILATKLHIPLPHPKFISRPRLIEKLNQGIAQGCKLSLISAPAGFGKTTLVSDWLSQLTIQHVTWLSLDEQDNDPARFMSYFMAALRQGDDKIGEQAKTLLQAPQPPSPETIMTTLINEITAVAKPLILVLDDYHLISSTPIHQTLAFLLEHQPAHFHLVLITRADPLLPLARFRARRQMSELRESDLRFTLGETVTFFNQIMGLELSPDQVETLARRTEGWIAGLQMAALSMQDQQDIPGFIHSFSGSHRFILDFLTDEVLRQRPGGTKDFLLQTAVLDRLCGPLCDAVTGQNNGQATLELLEQAGLFIIPLDQTRQWFRYHHLFGELLRYRLRVQGDPPEGLLHQRASQWFEKHGFLADAISHALEAQDWEKGATLIDQVSGDMLSRGQVITVIEWCQKLPEEILRAQPGLSLSYAWALLLLGQFDAGGEILNRLEVMAQQIPPLLGQVVTAQAYLARARGDDAQVIEKSRQALSLLPEDETFFRGTLALNLGLVYWHAGRLAEAEPVLMDASEMAEQTGNQYGQAAAQIFLARTLASRGKLRQAQAMLQEILSRNAQLPILALAHFDLALLYYEWNRLEEAGEQVRQGMELIERTGNLEFRYAGHVMQAMLRLAQGDGNGAWQAVETAGKVVKDMNPAAQARSAACHVQVALALGDVETAVRWSDQLLEDVDGHSFYRFLGLTRPRLLIAQGQKETAAAQLQARYETASRAGWGYGAIATRVWQALAADALETGLEFLEEALRLAAPESYLRTFVDAGDPLVPLLNEAANQGIMVEYVGKIIAAMGDGSRVGTRLDKPASSPLVEPLSERELEILRLLSERQTNAEIALALSVSVNTVKTHLQHIYEKLGVHGRRAAVNSAIEHNLL